MPNPLISQVKLPDNTVYDIKDSQARSDISAIYEIIEGGVHYIGAIADGASNKISDGSTKNPVTVKDGASTKSVTATAGDIVTQDADQGTTTEFIFDGTAWRELGDLSGLGDFAFADTGSGSFTPSGTVSQPTFQGSQSSVSVTATESSSGNYQPKGSVSQPTFTGTKVQLAGSVTPSGSISASFSGTGVRLVTGNIAVPSTYTTTLGSKSKDVIQPAESGTATYTPAGSVSGTAVELNTTTVNSITAVGTLPTMPTCTLPTATVNGEVLTFTAGSYTAGSPGTLPTKGSAQTVATTVKTVTDPTFSGTGVRLVGTVDIAGSASTTTASTTNKTATVSPTTGEATYTPAGTVTASFTGDSNTVTVTATENANGNYQPKGTVSQPTFTGTKVQLAGTTTAAGTVSQPTFSGTAGTVTVTPDTTP